jgi:periplasmic copper chaperone A
VPQRPRPRRWLPALAVLCAALSAVALSACGGGKSMEVTGAWMRATTGAANENTAIYATIANHQDAADHLISASVPASVAAEAQTHTTVRTGNQMVMQPVDGWDIPANGTLQLQPGGNHIMVMKVARQLKVGETITVTLRFQHAGTIEVPVEVHDIAASS